MDYYKLSTVKFIIMEKELTKQEKNAVRSKVILIISHQKTSP